MWIFKKVRIKVIERLIKWSRLRSPWILHLNTGACNACDIEIVDALTPRFDVERFGILLKASPRHADVIVCTGPVTRQMKDRIIRIYEQTPDPKFVIAVGACAMSGCVYRGAYNVLGEWTRLSRWMFIFRVVRPDLMQL